MTKRKFTAIEKLEIIKEAEETSNKRTAKLHGLSTQNIRQWRRKKDDLLQSNGSAYRLGRKGKKAEKSLVSLLDQAAASFSSMKPEPPPLPHHHHPTGLHAKYSEQTKAKCRVVAEKVLHETKWLRMKETVYSDVSDSQRIWTSIERTSSTRSDTSDAVFILPLIRSFQKITQVVLLVQFRPAVGNWVVELPAGLIDEGECPKEAAIRELKEETGFTAKNILSVGPPIVNDQGITNGSCRFIVCEIDGDDGMNSSPIQQLEECENIEVFFTPYYKLLETLNDLHETKGYAIDARLYSYALGLKGFYKA